MNAASVRFWDSTPGVTQGLVDLLHHVGRLIVLTQLSVMDVSLGAPSILNSILKFNPKFEGFYHCFLI